MLLELENIKFIDYAIFLQLLPSLLISHTKAAYSLVHFRFTPNLTPRFFATCLLSAHLEMFKHTLKMLNSQELIINMIVIYLGIAVVSNLPSRDS